MDDPRIGGRGRVSRVAVGFGVLVVLAVGAVVWGVVLNGGGPPTGGSGSPAPGSSQEPYVDWQGFKQTCNGPRAQPEAAAYAGAGPHRIALFEFGSGTEYADYAGLEPGWDAAEPSEAALIVCVTVVPTDVQVTTCSYTGVDALVMRADYELTVHEATTGALLKEERGTTDEAGCPEYIDYSPGEVPELSAYLDDAVVHDFLEPFVEASV